MVFAVSAELHEKKTSLTLDGTQRNGEAAAWVGRWCSEDYVIIHRPVLFVTTEKNVNGKELAALVANLWIRYGGILQELTCFARDGFSVDHAASRRLRTTSVRM